VWVGDDLFALKKFLMCMVEEKATAKVPKKGEDMIRAVCCMHACMQLGGLGWRLDDQ
jgi:hypothetical protein